MRGRGYKFALHSCERLPVCVIFTGQVTANALYDHFMVHGISQMVDRTSLQLQCVYKAVIIEYIVIHTELDASGIASPASIAHRARRLTDQPFVPNFAVS